MDSPSNRSELLSLLPKGSAGAEIGVFRGAFSRRIIEIVQPSLLYLVDAWRRLPKTNKRFTDEWHHSNLFTTISSMPNVLANGMVRPICAVSEVAFEYVLPQELDWVYIDADHTYRGCKKDIEMWSTKVRPGGMVMVHDYCAEYPGVLRAVDETGKKQGQTLEKLPTAWWTK
jgi:hypothetical protein